MNSGSAQTPLHLAVAANLVFPARSGTPSDSSLFQLGFLLIHFSHISNLKLVATPTQANLIRTAVAVELILRQVQSSLVTLASLCRVFCFRFLALYLIRDPRPQPPLQKPKYPLQILEYPLQFLPSPYRRRVHQQFPRPAPLSVPSPEQPAPRPVQIPALAPGLLPNLFLIPSCHSLSPATRHSLLVFSQISNLKFQIPFCLLPFAFILSKDPSRFRKDPSLKPEYPPLARNIPPYPRISPLPFAFATSSHTIISIATPRSTKNPYPDYQPLAHRKNTHWFCSILPSRTTAPGSLSQAQSGVFRANGTAPLLPDERSAISTRQTYRPLVGPNPRPSPWLGGS